MPDILLVEDESHYSVWSAKVLAAECSEWQVVVADTVSKAQALLESNPELWSLAIVDLNLGLEHGANFISQWAERRPDAPCLVVSAVESPAQVLAAFRAGAQGYLLKGANSTEFALAVRQVLSGGSPITPSIAHVLLNEFRATARMPQDRAPSGRGSLWPYTSKREKLLSQLAEPLTERESQVLGLLERGFSNKEAAQSLAISSATVDTHIRKIFRKLRVNSRVELRRRLA
jgi:DNA-binding NarL/FixJ family response regulator